VAARSLRQVFADDDDRGRKMSREAAGLYFDFSRNLVDETTVGLLADLATECGMTDRREAMFRGDLVNTTEGRPALHVALRMPPERSLLVDGVDVVREVHRVLARMSDFSDRVRTGAWRGATDRPIRSVVNIGIGGSDLGPEMAYRALEHYSLPELDFHFVSNVDSTDLSRALDGLDPAETLFVVCSKTFTTLETMTNARAARSWLLDSLGGGDESVSRHFVAVSTNADAVSRFGIEPGNMFGFWDWVGGRYSIDSAIGLSTMLAIGPDRFHDLLAGFHDVDEHFRQAPTGENIPALHGLLAVWYRNFLGARTQAVLPYSQYLDLFPAYLQQLTMESNGKRVDLSGRPVEVDTGAVWWGAAGTNGQHSFFQLLHQGTELVPADFILVARSLDPIGDQQDLLVANLLAQTEALAFGRTAEEALAQGMPGELVAHRTFPGNRPSSTLMIDALTPRSLGALIALYEHSVFVQASIWGINPFDQWGVELGKELALDILPSLSASTKPGRDSSTDALIERYRAAREA
jgi:glucose-6-phosphate isomerase